MEKTNKPTDKASQELSPPKEAGRPTKYKPEFCEMLIDHMSEGYSFESFGAIAQVWDTTLDDWANTIPEFSEAKMIGRRKQLFANEKLIRDVAKYGEGNATAAIFILKNCHPKTWRDRREIEITPPKDMTQDELIREAEELLKQVKK
jgi:transposase